VKLALAVVMLATTLATVGAFHSRGADTADEVPDDALTGYFAMDVEDDVIVVRTMLGPVFRVTRAGGHPSVRRARLLAYRLDRMAREGRVADIRVRRVKHEFVLFWDGRPMMTVDTSMAIVCHAERRREELARWWAALLVDEMRLFAGHPPTLTLGTAPGAQLQRLHAAAREICPSGPIPSRVLREILASGDSGGAGLSTAWLGIPSGFPPPLEAGR